jgi:DNA-binding transcriptional MerR regulator
MKAQDGQVWTVGQLAARTGLTVRALHHYDHLGLVRPSERTPSGYRLYVKSDVERLYEVLALRQLGLPLETIGKVLRGHSPLGPVLERHRAYLDRQLVAICTLRAQLGSVAAQMHGGGPVTVAAFLELIRKVITVDETVQRYFSGEQLALLAERRAQLGEQAVARVQAAWPDLIGRVQAAVDAGTDPASAPAQELAAEWMGLLEQFHGGDDGLRDSLHRMYAENAEQIQAEHGGPPPALIGFIRAASASRR